MDLYGDGHKIVTDEKVNTNSPLYVRVNNEDEALALFQSVVGDNNGARLRAIRFTFDGGNPIVAQYGVGIQVGENGVSSLININAFDPKMQVSTTNDNSTIKWSEFVAWKSDVQKLQDQIDQLKNQIEAK